MYVSLCLVYICVYIYLYVYIYISQHVYHMIVIRDHRLSHIYCLLDSTKLRVSRREGRFSGTRYRKHHNRKMIYISVSFHNQAERDKHTFGSLRRYKEQVIICKRTKRTSSTLAVVRRVRV